MKTKQLVLSLALAFTAFNLPQSAYAEKKLDMKKEIKKLCEELDGEFWEDGDEYGCSLEDKDEIHCHDYIDECDLFVDGEIYNPNPLKRKKMRKLKSHFGIKSVGSTQDLYAKYPELGRKKKPKKSKISKKFGGFNIIAPNN